MRVCHDGSDISTRNSPASSKIFPVEIVGGEPGFLKCGMAKKVEPDCKPLYLGEWIEATGYDQKEVVKETKVSQPYISNLSGGRKSNPSAHILRLISEHIGVTMNDLYLRPPAMPKQDTLNRYSQAAQEALLRPKRKRA